MAAHSLTASSNVLRGRGPVWVKVLERVTALAALRTNSRDYLIFDIAARTRSHGRHEECSLHDTVSIGSSACYGYPINPTSLSHWILGHNTNILLLRRQQILRQLWSPKSLVILSPADQTTGNASSEDTHGACATPMRHLLENSASCTIHCVQAILHIILHPRFFHSDPTLHTHPPTLPEGFASLHRLYPSRCVEVEDQHSRGRYSIRY